jgi:hypothetical protein
MLYMITGIIIATVGIFYAFYILTEDKTRKDKI